MRKIVELLDLLNKKSENYGEVSFNKGLLDLIKEAREEYEFTKPSPLPNDFVEIG